MAWTKRRDTKQMQFRSSSGRYARAPTLVDMGARICPCGAILMPLPMERDERGFVDPMTARRYPECSRCAGHPSEGEEVGRG